MNRLTAQQVAVLSLLACAVIINSILYDFMGLPWTFPLFIGDRTESIFDIWTIKHTLWGIVMGTLFLKIISPKLPNSIVYFGTLLITAYTWEGVEVWMEYEVSICELCGWKWGFEHWSNHLVSDPFAMALLGGTIAKKWKNTWKWVLPIFLIWMFISYCFPATSPNGAHLHHLLSNLFR